MKVFKKYSNELIETGLEGLIFCNKCKFYKEVRLCGTTDHRCDHPSLAKLDICYVTPIETEYEKVHVFCEAINENNDCRLFEPIQQKEEPEFKYVCRDCGWVFYSKTSMESLGMLCHKECLKAKPYLGQMEFVSKVEENSHE